MRYNEKLVERHEKQLCDLVEATRKQTRRIRKRKKRIHPPKKQYQHIR